MTNFNFIDAAIVHIRVATRLFTWLAFCNATHESQCFIINRQSNILSSIAMRHPILSSIEHVSIAFVMLNFYINCLITAGSLLTDFSVFCISVIMSPYIRKGQLLANDLYQYFYTHHWVNICDVFILNTNKWMNLMIISRSRF